MTESDALRILNLQPGCSADEVRQAYLDLVKVWHPDRFQSDGRLTARAERELRDINDAYGLLQAGTRSKTSTRDSPAQSSPAEQESRFTPRPRSSGSPETPSQFSLARSIVMGIGLGLVVAAVVTVMLLITREPQPPAATNAGAASTTSQRIIDSEPQVTAERPPRIASHSTLETARPESGTEILAPGRSGGSSLVVSNGSQRDAVIALDTGNGYDRAVYVRAGEQITVANIAAGTYRVRMMLGQNWVDGRFTRNLAYQELDQPVAFAEKDDGGVTEYTRLTVSLQPVAVGVRGIRPVRPFRITQ
jgi:hypothetical protein